MTRSKTLQDKDLLVSNILIYNVAFLVTIFYRKLVIYDKLRNKYFVYKFFVKEKKDFWFSGGYLSHFAE